MGKWIVGTGLGLHKEHNSYYVTYAGKLVWNVSGNDLLHEIYGGKNPPVSDYGNYLNTKHFAIRVGHANDMLLAFGIIKSGQETKGLQVLHWYPRDGGMNISFPDDNTIHVQYGINNDLRTRICWNGIRPNEWAFSSNQRTGKFDPCTIDGSPYSPNQYLVSFET